MRSDEDETPTGQLGLQWTSPKDGDYGMVITTSDLTAKWYTAAGPQTADGTFEYHLRRGPLDDRGNYYGKGKGTVPWYVPAVVTRADDGATATEGAGSSKESGRELETGDQYFAGYAGPLMSRQGATERWLKIATVRVKAEQTQQIAHRIHQEPMLPAFDPDKRAKDPPGTLGARYTIKVVYKEDDGGRSPRRGTSQKDPQRSKQSVKEYEFFVRKVQPKMRWPLLLEAKSTSGAAAGRVPINIGQKMTAADFLNATFISDGAAHGNRGLHKSMIVYRLIKWNDENDAKNTYTDKKSRCRGEVIWTHTDMTDTPTPTRTRTAAAADDDDEDDDGNDDGGDNDAEYPAAAITTTSASDPVLPVFVPSGVNDRYWLVAEFDPYTGPNRDEFDAYDERGLPQWDSLVVDADGNKAAGFDDSVPGPCPPAHALCHLAPFAPFTPSPLCP